MYECRLGFRSQDSFQSWLQKRIGEVPKIVQSMLSDIIVHGLVEPISNRYFDKVEIDRSKLQISLDAGPLNARKRAGLLAVQTAVGCLKGPNRFKPRILGAEAVTYVAAVLRAAYPHYLGTEYLPTPEEQAAQYPIPHLDLMDIRLPEGSFDVFFSAHVLEHVPDIQGAIHQVARILKPGGMLVSTFPFSLTRTHTETKARIGKDGATEFLTEPEYHKNPVRLDEGSLVFQLPGWDVLEMCRAAGLTSPLMVLMASTRHGVISGGTTGQFALIARKPAPGDESDVPFLREIEYRGAYI